jgi:hypothetical protein
LRRRTAWPWLAVLALALASPCFAAETVFSAASRQDPFETAGVAARAMAMGTAFVGVADDSTAILWNPAGMAGVRSSEISAHHLSGLAGIRQEVVSASMPAGPRMGVGVYGQYIGYGTFEGSDGKGDPTGDYAANQMGLGAGAGMRVFEGLSVGLAVRANQQTFAGQSYALFNADTGVMVSLDPGWRLGASYSNLGVSSGAASAASVFRIGASETFWTSSPFSLLAALAATIEPRTGNNLLLGMEGGYRALAFLRAGYRLKLRQTGTDGMTGLTAGGGLQYRSLRLDYAFEPFGDIGSTNRVSMVYRFGSGPAPVRAAAAVPVTVIRTVVEPVMLPSTAPVPLGAPPTPTPATAAFVTPEPVGEDGASGSELTVRFALASEDVAKGEELEKEGRYQEAFRWYLSAVQRDRNDSTAWWRLGNLYYRYRMREQAIRCYEEVLRLKPENAALSEWLRQYKNPPVPPQPQASPAQ